jgi:hypothetical protein
MTGHRSALPPRYFITLRLQPTTRAILVLRYNITGKRARWAMWSCPQHASASVWAMWAMRLRVSGKPDTRSIVGNVGNRKQIAHMTHKHAGGGVGAGEFVGNVGNVGIPTKVGGARLYARPHVLCA